MEGSRRPRLIQSRKIHFGQVDRRRTGWTRKEPVLAGCFRQSLMRTMNRSHCHSVRIQSLFRQSMVRKSRTRVLQTCHLAYL